MLSFSETLIQVPESKRPQAALNERGELQYGDSGIPVVGARKLTLGEAVDPLLVFRSGEDEPVAVQLPVSTVADHPGLAGLLRTGSLIEAEPEPLVQIPYPLWQEHAEEAVGFWLPERDAAGVDRALALAEREHRFAKQEAELTGYVRNCFVVLATRLGRGRRVVGELADLSVGRIQQLNDDPPLEVTRFVESAAAIAGWMGKKARARDEIVPPPELDQAEFDLVLDSMLAMALLEEVPDGLLVTEDGRALLDHGKGVRRSRGTRKRSGGRERAHDADQ
jgi:hypothetical protein